MSGIEQDSLGLTFAKMPGHVAEAVQQAPMIVQCALGLAGRAGSEETIDKIILRELLDDDAVVPRLELLVGGNDDIRARADIGRDIPRHPHRSCTGLLHTLLGAV